jgi:hypothetical protein
MAQQDRPVEVRLWQHGLIFLAACAVLICRRPDAILHAQFWAEDGHVWFADAYNCGWWVPLFRAQDGYFQTLPRLVASIALIVPLSWAPFILNLVATAFQALPANLLLSSRSSPWGSFQSRTTMAAIYLLLPNCTEMSYGITESQWLLALSAFLVLVASSPTMMPSRIFDALILLLSGLTGPFCIFLLPISLFFAFKRHSRWQWGITGMLAMLCLVQLWGLMVLNPSGRPRVELGASIAMFTRIVGSQVFLGALLGGNGTGLLPGTGIFIFQLCAAIAGITMVAICFINSGNEMKLFLCFSTALLAASLIFPAGYLQPGSTRWQQLACAGPVRYWFFPTLAFAWSLFRCLQVNMVPCKIAAGFLLLFMCFGIVRDLRHPALNDLHFELATIRLEAAEKGSNVIIPLNPPGWNMMLVKHLPGY